MQSIDYLSRLLNPGYRQRVLWRCKPSLSHRRSSKAYAKPLRNTSGKRAAFVVSISQLHYWRSGRCQGKQCECTQKERHNDRQTDLEQTPWLLKKGALGPGTQKKGRKRGAKTG